MHATALKNAGLFFRTYVDRLAAAKVVDIGSQDINGSLRSVCPAHAQYVGVDFVAGKGVDVILEDPYVLPFPNESVDVIVSSSCFEHSEMFWLVYLEIMRVLKPAGLFYVNAPSNGWYHRHPVDCWRFYPDCGLALVTWGRRNGLDNALLESYVGNQGTEMWNDFVAVFVKDAAHSRQHPDRILNGFSDFTNGWIDTGAGELQSRSPNALPQDQRLLGWRIHKQLANFFGKFKARR